MVLCDCFTSFTISLHHLEIFYILIPFHQANHFYILRIEVVQEQSLEEHQDKYFSKKFGHLKLSTADENVGNLLLVLANHYPRTQLK